MDDSRRIDERKKPKPGFDYDAEDYPSSSRHAHDASGAPLGETGRGPGAGGLTRDDAGSSGPNPPRADEAYGRELGSEPIVGGDGQLADSRLPSDDDWDYRPGSPSERFTEPETERAFARTFLRAGPNYPAITGVALALLGFVSGLFGLLAAALGFMFSATGIWSSRHGASRGYLAVFGVIVSVVYLAGHISRAV